MNSERRTGPARARTPLAPPSRWSFGRVAAWQVALPERTAAKKNRRPVVNSWAHLRQTCRGLKTWAAVIIVIRDWLRAPRPRPESSSRAAAFPIVGTALAGSNSVDRARRFPNAQFMIHGDARQVRLVNHDGQFVLKALGASTSIGIALLRANRIDDRLILPGMTL